MSSHEPIEATVEAADRSPALDAKPEHRPRLGRRSWRYALTRAIKEFSADGGTDLAAMLTHFTVLSLAPVLLGILSVVSLILTSNTETVTWLVADLTTRYVPADYQELVVNLIRTIMGSYTGSLIALTLAIATALWSSSGYVQAFSRCMNAIYGREEGRGLLKRTGAMLLVALVMLAGVVLILVSLALNHPIVSGLLGPIAEPLGLSGLLDFLLRTFLPVWTWAKWLVILAVAIAVVAVLYYFTPNVRKPKFTWFSPGSVVAIAGIGTASLLLWLYLTRFAGYSAYGAVSTAIAALFVLWAFNIMLLLGAEVDAEVERVRELQAGIEAEVDIQLPPRSMAKVEKMKASRERLESTGRELRLSHTGEGSTEGPTLPGNDTTRMPDGQTRKSS